MQTDATQIALPLNAPESVVTCCTSEAHAVRICLDLAFRLFGRDQKTVSALCGWESDSCLSEIKKDSTARNMPKTRRARFAIATGCNLLNQYIDWEADRRAREGRATERDRTNYATSLCISTWDQANAAPTERAWRTA